MSPMFITFVVMVVTVLAAAAWMDFKRRRLGDTRSSGDMSRRARQLRVEGRGKSSESGLGL